MSRESQGYRDTLDWLFEKYPDKLVLKYSEIAEITGQAKITVQRHFKPYYNKMLGGVPKTKIAQIMCKGVKF